MIKTAHRPTATFILLGYNQKLFMDAAIDGVFAQTGSPLEIIFADDCSTDGTYEIMRERMDRYHGPHRVVLLRTKTNMGIAGNLNQALQHATGEIIIIAAGDDISVPERSEKLINRLSGNEVGAPVLAVSYFEEMDVSGKLTGFVKKAVSFVPDTTKDVAAWRCGATGACMAYRRVLYDKYGPLNRNVIAEDWVFAFRAWLEGIIAVVNEPLVIHRTHDESSSSMARDFSTATDRRDRYQRRRKNQAGAQAIAEEWLKAWQIAKGDTEPEIEDKLRQLVRLRQVQTDAFDATPWSLIGIIRRAWRHGSATDALKLGVRHGLRVY